MSSASYNVVLQGKLGCSKISKQLIDLMSCPTMEIREHAVITLANMALSYDNHVSLSACKFVCVSVGASVLE